MLQVLLDPTGERVATASAATEMDGRLFLGSLMGGALPGGQAANAARVVHGSLGQHSYVCVAVSWEVGCLPTLLATYGDGSEPPG